MKIKVILTALILTATLTACTDKPEVTDIPAETTAETTVTTVAELGGTFNEEVFDEVVNNIVIGDKTISLPCTIGDLGEDFSYSTEFPYYDKENGVAFYGLLYNEEEIGTAVFKYDPDDKELNDNQILGLSLGTIFMERENSGLYLAGLTLNDTEEAVIDKLGQPTKFNGENGNGIMYYRVFNNDFVDEKYITIDLENGKVSKLHIQLPINSKPVTAPGGTFNEEVFDEVVNNIVIGDKTISLPCTIGDFGVGFELGGFSYFDKEHELLSAAVLHDGNTIGYFTIKCTEGDDDWNDNLICGLDFSSYDLEKQSNIDFISIGGITFQDTKDSVIKKFGEPTETNEYDTGTENLRYIISNEKLVFFNFNTDDKVSMLSITIPTP